MVRMVLRALLPPPTPEQLADLVNYHLERNNEVRDARYRARGLEPPPRHPMD